MHESSLTENLLDHVLKHARDAGARNITRVKVSIGALSDATQESIQFYWDNLAPGSIAENALLEFDIVQGTARCETCFEEFEITELYESCPRCGGFPITVLSGNGVYLSSLEVDTQDERHELIQE